MPAPMPSRIQLFSGWGNFPVAHCYSYRPEKQKQINYLYQTLEEHILARGMGMSYGDASLNPTAIIQMERLNRFLGFDKAHGIIHVQAGVTLAEIIDISVPSGWFLPVIPGTKYASVGGCIACNTHGKNHYKRGDIARHVIDIALRLASGELIHCSPQNEVDIFWATAGGMGMTGTIEEVTLQLMPITTAFMDTESVQVENLEDMIKRFEENIDKAEYLVGWIDHFAKRKSLGKGIFEKANHVDAPGSTPVISVLDGQQEKKLNIPFFTPGFLLNKYTMACYNRLQFRHVEKYPTEQVKDFSGFFHPLDRIGHWNRLYGRKGFFQYQCMIPKSEKMLEQLRHILQTIQKSGLFSFLAVIKYHGPHQGMLSFPIEGFSLALDFPNTSKVRALLDILDAYVADIGGRVYLAKDARMKPEYFEKMYADQLPQWRKIVKELDPKGKHCSNMAKRLRFRDDLGT